MDEVNEKENPDIIIASGGGMREKIGVRFDLIPYEALYEIAKVFAYGAEKYEDNNWKGLDFRSGEQTPLNHALMHLSHATSMPFGTLQRRWQLAKAATNITMEIWGEVYLSDNGCDPKTPDQTPKPDQPDPSEGTPPVLAPFARIWHRGKEVTK